MLTAGRLSHSWTRRYHATGQLKARHVFWGTLEYVRLRVRLRAIWWDVASRAARLRRRVKTRLVRRVRRLLRVALLDAGHRRTDSKSLGADRVWRTSSEGVLRLADCPAALTVKMLPSNLVVEPGLYSLPGSRHTFDLSAPGLYRGAAINGSGGWQRVVLKHTSSGLSAAMTLAELGIHGWLDNHRGLQDAIRVAVARPLLQTCGYFSSFCVYLLETHGFTARRVHWFRSGTFNGSDDGHTMIEIFDVALGKWVCVDVDQKRVFSDDSGVPLSAHEIWRRGFSAVTSRPFGGQALSDVLGLGRQSGPAMFPAMFVADLTDEWLSEIGHHLGLDDAGRVVCVGAPSSGTAGERYTFVAEETWLQWYYNISKLT